MKQLPFLNHAADPQRPAIIVPVQATSAEDIARQCGAIADTALVDVIEWRIDSVIDSVADQTSQGAVAIYPQRLAEAVLGLAVHVSTAGLPVLITLRTGFEGGSAEVSEDVYTEILRAVITGLPEKSGRSEATGGTAGVTWALDVEIDRRGAAELIDLAHDQGLSVVASHHNFAATDSAEALATTFTRMAAAAAEVAKIAMMPVTRADVAELLRATALAEETLEIPVLGISMGQLGRTSRVMGADFGSCATFAQLGEASAPGQIAVADLAGIIDSLYG
ncbi:type I 3-dehydroquinate dehydratase [Brevibacterium sp. UCMA 11754]|uniref:type I 3-dehydroquinate dehydratase n=1 Tax=Brevibacterium sp. UCMA 11754 TaxID=2749198 RepID=UPI001F1837ED|nr:type I 3-dehydroquinate dehydratase [Brevibacterium sp. UCMA 11754]MCF2572255.1 type I 3-dehydroquinate dehydratase [Brevibacterium sp. UCMA 11754]